MKPNDKDARSKYTECSKIVKRIAFEKAIAVEENKKSVLDSINIDAMGECLNFVLSVALLFETAPREENRSVHKDNKTREAHNKRSLQYQRHTSQ